MHEEGRTTGGGAEGALVSGPPFVTLLCFSSQSYDGGFIRIKRSQEAQDVVRLAWEVQDGRCNAQQVHTRMHTLRQMHTHTRQSGP